MSIPASLTSNLVKIIITSQIFMVLLLRVLDSQSLEKGGRGLLLGCRSLDDRKCFILCLSILIR